MPIMVSELDSVPGLRAAYYRDTTSGLPRLKEDRGSWGKANDIFSDDHIHKLSRECEEALRRFVPPGHIVQYVEETSSNDPREPFLDTIKNTVWDNEERVDSWLTKAFGAGVGSPKPISEERLKYISLVGRYWLIQAMRRRIQPGCQADYMMVLEGKQGLGKSAALRTLFGNDYTLEDIGDISGNQVSVMQRMQGKALWIMDELDAVVNARAWHAVKSFITQCQVDQRLPYGRRSQTFKRSGVFVGTTNDTRWIHDPTGGRRFWPIRVTKVDMDWIEKNRMQLLKEAYDLAVAGKKYWPSQEEEADYFYEEQDARQAIDPWTMALREALHDKKEVPALEIYKILEIPYSQTNSKMQSRISAIMIHKLGWKQSRPRNKENKTRPIVWRKVDNQNIGDDYDDMESLL